MAIVVTLPDLGENIKAGELTAILVKPGDILKADTPILELETDKAVVEVPAGRAGKVLELLARTGERLEVGAAVLTVEEAEGAAEGTASLQLADPEPTTPAPSVPSPVVEATTPVAVAPVATSPGPAGPLAVVGDTALPVPASPTVRRLARELGVEIRQVPGTGPAGRISREDVKAYVKRRLEGTARLEPGGPGLPAEDLPDFSRFGEIEELPLSAVRRATAQHLAKAWLLTPRVTQMDKADITSLEAFRLEQQRKLDKSPGAPRLTMTAILIRLLAEALKRFPQANASLDMARERMIRKHYCHVGVAVDTERGLLVPVLRDADRKGVLEIARELGELSRKARERKTGPEDLQGACITLTNLGGIGGGHFTPIVNHPEAAILGVGRAATEAVWNAQAKAFEPRLLLPLSLSYDHRILDGADGARITRWLCEALENPMTLLL